MKETKHGKITRWEDEYKGYTLYGYHYYSETHNNTALDMYYFEDYSGKCCDMSTYKSMDELKEHIDILIMMKQESKDHNVNLDI